MTRKEMMCKLQTLGPVVLLVAGLAGPPALADDDGFELHLDSILIGVLEKDVDTESAKFEEYRDIGNGFVLTNLRISGREGDRKLAFRADRVGFDDARYGLDYGVEGSYAVDVDYNKIIHRFGNNATSIWNRTAPGEWRIADSAQAQIQGEIFANPFPSSGLLTDLVTPYLEAAGRFDLLLQRDRTRIGWDLGKMGRMAWAAEYKHENRDGLRPYGGNFGFFNVTEIAEPIDYDTTDAEISGEWNGEKGGLRFGYRHSMFENNISTMVWDNPFVAVDGTSPRAYLGPNLSPVSGSQGIADLAPDNEADVAYLSGRVKKGGWWLNGNFNYNVMTQNDPLLPYTINTAIIGNDPVTGATFNASDPSNLPVRRADNEVEVLSLTGNAGTELGDSVDLTFRYRYYDYANNSPRIEIPGYVRMHAAWESHPRVTVPYAYTKQDAGVELDWDASDRAAFGVSYRMVSWDREFREVSNSDEDIVKVTFDLDASSKAKIRGSWETGDRSIDGYVVEAQLLTFLEEDLTINNQPSLRKYAQAAREYDDWDLSLQLQPSNAVHLVLGVSGRDDTYPESEMGLIGDDITQYNFEVGYTPGADDNFYLFGHMADRNVLQRARQSGGTLSTDPNANWQADLDETWDTWGLGWMKKRGACTLDLTARLSDSDGEADFTTPPGGTPSSAVDFDNYEDIELLAVKVKFNYAVRDNAKWGLYYLYEDYTIDSFINAGVTPYIPGAFLLAGNFGDYEASVVGVSLQFSF